MMLLHNAIKERKCGNTLLLKQKPTSALSPMYRAFSSAFDFQKLDSAPFFKFQLFKFAKYTKSNSFHVKLVNCTNVQLLFQFWLSWRLSGETKTETYSNYSVKVTEFGYNSYGTVNCLLYSVCQLSSLISIRFVCFVCQQYRCRGEVKKLPIFIK